MKKLLSLLSVLTISGTAVPTTIAASPYQKQEIIKNIDINYSQTNNLEKLNRNKRLTKECLGGITKGGTEGAVGTGVGGALTGAAAGSVIPGVGTILEAIAGAATKTLLLVMLPEEWRRGPLPIVNNDIFVKIDF